VKEQTTANGMINSVSYLVVQLGIAFGLIWIIWILTQRVKAIEEKLRGDSILFAQMQSAQEQGKKELNAIDVLLARHEAEMGKQVDALRADHNVMMRRLDDLYHTGKKQ
jgi:hypothetical protein